MPSRMQQSKLTIMGQRVLKESWLVVDTIRQFKCNAEDIVRKQCCRRLLLRCEIQMLMSSVVRFTSQKFSGRTKFIIIAGGR